MTDLPKNAPIMLNQSKSALTRAAEEILAYRFDDAVNALLDIKRQTGHRNDSGQDPHALLDLIAARVESALAGESPRVPRVVVTTDGGQIQQVVKDSPVEVLVVDYCVGDADESDPRVRRVDGELAEMALFEANEDVLAEDTARFFEAYESDELDDDADDGMDAFVDQLVGNCDFDRDAAVRFANDLQRLSERHRKLCEIDSNEGLSRQQKNAREEIERLIVKCTATVDGIDQATFNYDPRVLTVGVRFRSKASDSLAGVWKVPADEDLFAALGRGPFWNEFIKASKGGMSP